ncbi:hypothetical protein RHMOL_Rhmol08G0305400 [Rhododendron molle]|uniref:Uncharacterized protein n=1 Tax=Rhododendron molle TaxID=49168 RepID=A0ACC0MW68_RHOML|nr:hypothetical protein RHMOL_Rhmol08G0305400 [Rhododendron molle]
MSAIVGETRGDVGNCWWWHWWLRSGRTSRKWLALGGVLMTRGAPVTLASWVGSGAGFRRRRLVGTIEMIVVSWGGDGMWFEALKGFLDCVEAKYGRQYIKGKIIDHLAPLCCSVAQFWVSVLLTSSI